MALNDCKRGSWGVRLHLLVRLLGLTGLVAAAVGLGIALVQDLQPDAFLPALKGESADPVPVTAAWLLAGGGAAVLLLLLVEAIVVLRMVAGRRSLFGSNAAFQTAVAVVLLVGVNVWSFQNYVRQDWTRTREFTLPEAVRTQLSGLRGGEGKTTIVVYKQHRAFGALSETVDAYETAAEEKVVEKVNDLVEQFRELGPQFEVVVLDVKEKEEQKCDDGPGAAEEPVTPVNQYRDRRKGFQEKLADLPAELRQAVEAAPENSIFFHAGGRVQRLSFNDLYRLDKRASCHSRNLVLKDQGIQPFADRVLNIEEKRPRVGILVVHEWLTTEGPEDFGLAGVKKTLTAYGFDVRDIILKKWSEFAPPEPAVATYDETKLDRLEEELAEYDEGIKTYEERLKLFGELKKDWDESTPEELSKKYAKNLGGRKVTEKGRQAQVAEFARILENTQTNLDAVRKEREKTLKEKEGLNVDAATEQRRMNDLKAKLERLLADCDVLLIPRMTLRNVVIGDRIPNRAHNLNEAQVAAVEDFLKSGKPVLACFGPTNEPAAGFDPTSDGKDKLEDVLAKLGIKFGKQTVLFNSESKAFAERRSGLQSGGGAEIPPVSFMWEPGSGGPFLREEVSDLGPNPIRESMQLTERSVGKAFDLRLRHPRPIYFDPPAGQKPGTEAVFMMTAPEAWNEDQPFPTRERTPRFEKQSRDDPAVGTPDEKRQGRFSIGVAVEVPLPEEWRKDRPGAPETIRVAAIGHGGLFVGPELSPTKEKLLLHTTNWLLGRDDHLPREVRTWAYPRVALSERDRDLWHWGTQLGLPLLFAYLGGVVLLVRRLR